MHKLIALITILISSLHAESSQWIPLFNGKNLDGWDTLPGGKWSVENGIITGSSKKSETRHGLLITQKTYKNFILRAKFKITKGDSGLYFRAQKTKKHVAIKGFQAEVDNSPEVGGLYETDLRAWVKKPDPNLIKSIYTPNTWTQITVTALGDNITVSLNGIQVTTLPNDTKGLKSGHIALQLHSNMEMLVQFKDISILKLP